MEKAKLEKIRRALGARVRALRKAKKFSQEEFAFECELSRTYMGSVERGERNISIDNIAKIADALGITASELLQGVK
jgi:transcriptional regulator with XRE-family HTH domain